MLDSCLLEDPAEIHQDQNRRRNHDLRWVLVIIALSMAGMALFDHLFALPGESRALISLLVGCVALMSYQMQRGHLRQWLIPVVVVIGLVSNAWEMYSYGSVRSAASLGLLGAVVMAGTFLRLRLLLATTVAAVLILGVLTWAEAGGMLVRPGLAPDLRFWLVGGVIIAVIGATLHHTRKATDEAYLLQLNQMEDRLRLEHERDQSQRRFKRIFSLNPTALMIQFACTQTVLKVNPAFKRGFGYPGDQLVGQPAERLWADEQQWRAHCRVLFERGRTGWQRGRWRRSDGQVVEVLVSSELTEDPSGLLILTTVVDGPDAQDAGGALTVGCGARS